MVARCFVPEGVADFLAHSRHDTEHLSILSNHPKGSGLFGVEDFGSLEEKSYQPVLRVEGEGNVCAVRTGNRGPAVLHVLIVVVENPEGVVKVDPEALPAVYTGNHYLVAACVRFDRHFTPFAKSCILYNNFASLYS